MSDRLSGSCVVVVGGSSGSGLATAELAATVAIAACNADKIANAASAIGANWAAFDMIELASVERWAKSVGPVAHLTVLAL